MRKALLIVVFSILVVPFAHADDNGLIKLKSPYSVAKTIDRFEHAVKKKGMTIFARVDHTKGAKKVDLKLRPTTVLIFGNPKIGTLLMQSQQTAGIDLPLKLLAWQDADGQVWIAYNDPGYIAKRHNITDRDPVIAKMRKAMSNFTAIATGK